MRHRRLTDLPKRLLRDQRGVSAIEFALIAPIMILIYFGLVEFSQGFMAERRSSHAASIVADLVAQSSQTSKKDLDSIFQVGDVVMKPFAASSLSVMVSSVTVDSRGVATVEWSHANGRDLKPLDRNSRVADLPPGLIAAGESVILGETQYRYTSAIGKVLPNDIVFKRRYFLLPRSTERIPCPDCNPK